MTTDPFDALALPPEPVRPRTDFIRQLKARLEAALGPDAVTEAAAETGTDTDSPARLPGELEPLDIPTIDLPPRRLPMPTTTERVTTAVTPYLAVHDGVAALTFYAEAFDAVETLRFVSDDGRMGHAEFTVGPARFYLSDEFPEMDVVSPRTLGGTTVALHLEVGDVDELYTRALAAGATSLREPADQPYGARQAGVRDPFGHRWMLSQPLETLSTAEMADRMADDGWTVEAGGRATAADPSAAPDAAADPSAAPDAAADPSAAPDAAADSSAAGRPTPVGAGGIWAAVVCRDAPAVIRFLTEVAGFEAQLVVPGEEPEVVIHSQIQWPEGGIVQIVSAERPDNAFSQRPVGSENLYVITADPMAVYRRCVEAGATILSEPASTDYDPDGLMFTTTDPEGNYWTFGTYAGEG